MRARGVFPSWEDVVAEQPVISIVRLDHFSGAPDPRQKGKVPYPPPEILPRGPCGVLCGAESCAEIEEHGAEAGCPAAPSAVRQRRSKP